MDIEFTTLDFNDKYTLPPTSKENGYISMNATAELCDIGSFSLVFHDVELEYFVKEHPEGLLVNWGYFEGYCTDYQYKEKEKQLYGSHINSLIHKVVFPPQNITEGTVEETLKSLINTHAPWLMFDETGFDDFVEFSTETYMQGDKFLNAYLGKLKWGYRIYTEKNEIHFRIVKPEHNPLVFSEGNRNIYEISEDFSCKEAAYGGWYRKTEEDNGTKLEDEQWLYITTEEKDGIYKRDVVLSAHSPQAALDELKARKEKRTHLAKTRNVEYGTHYTIGQIIKLRANETVKKQVQSVEFWYERDTYHEEPVFTEWEE